MRGWFPLVCLVGLLACCVTNAHAAVVYVNCNSIMDGPGNDWDHAFHTVQAGLSAAASGDDVWVAKGSYVECITLTAGVGLYGGFAGTETSRSQRNWTANVTILDGNQSGSVVTVPPGADLATCIDGFTIRNGNAFTGGGVRCESASPTISNDTVTGNLAAGACGDESCDPGYGGGIYCSNSSPMITNSNITGNTAYGCGAGIYCTDFGSPTITNVSVTANIAKSSWSEGGGWGGGICCQSSSPTISSSAVTGNTGTQGNPGNGICCVSGSVTITDNKITGGVSCSGSATITGNTIAGGVYCSDGSAVIANNAISGSQWSGIYCSACSPLISHNTITDNSAEAGTNDGGGIYCQSSSPTITSNTITGNSARYGGGIYCDSCSSAIIRDNIITGNYAPHGGGMYCINCSPTVSDNFFEDNTLEDDCSITIAQSSRYFTTYVTTCLTGTASSAFGSVIGANWSNSLGGSGACAGTTSWSANGLPLQPGDNVITVNVVDSAGNSGAAQITVTRLLPIPVGAARQMPSSAPAWMQNAIVTATTIDSTGVFVESADRSAGIKLVTSQPLSVGQRVCFTGVTGRVNGEYQISNVTFMDSAAGTPLAPLMMTTKTIGNDRTETLNYGGVNTTGLLVRIVGTVTGVVSSQRVVYVDDGYGFEDGVFSALGILGIRVHVPLGVSLPPKYGTVMVTGVSRVEQITLSSPGEVNGDLWPAGTVLYVPGIWVRGASDIAYIGGE